MRPFLVWTPSCTARERHPSQVGAHRPPPWLHSCRSRSAGDAARHCPGDSAAHRPPPKPHPESTSQNLRAAIPAAAGGCFNKTGCAGGSSRFVSTLVLLADFPERVPGKITLAHTLRELCQLQLRKPAIAERMCCSPPSLLIGTLLPESHQVRRRISQSF